MGHFCTTRDDADAPIISIHAFPSDANCLSDASRERDRHRREGSSRRRDAYQSVPSRDTRRAVGDGRPTVWWRGARVVPNAFLMMMPT